VSDQTGEDVWTQIATRLTKVERERGVLVEALEAALSDITETAKIQCSEYVRKTKKYVFNDKHWKAKSPGSFAVALQVRAALSQPAGQGEKP
jgi:Zn-dependent peptidase ImmA (M78 family)